MKSYGRANVQMEQLEIGMQPGTMKLRRFGLGQQMPSLASCIRDSKTCRVSSSTIRLGQGSIIL